MQVLLNDVEMFEEFEPLDSMYMIRMESHVELLSLLSKYQKLYTQLILHC